MPGYDTECRFFQDSPDWTKIHWYAVPKDRPCLPYASFVEDSDWTNNNGPRATIYKGNHPDIQGEQWTDRPATRRPHLPGEDFTGHFCGTREQWGGSLRTDRPADMGFYGSCDPNRLGAFDCGFDSGFDSWGPCGAAFDCGYSSGFDSDGACT